MELIDLRPCFLFFLFLLMSILGVVSRVDGHIADFDEVWQERAKKAQEDALAAYHPNPEEVTGHLNHEVKLSLSRNESRRQLAVNRGNCVATNPIDQCWRCKQDWESNRKQLADCVVGFGRNTTGGKDGNIYVVYDSSDDELVTPIKGTLRHAVIQDEPLWIIFSRSMMIRLTEELMVNSNKTIDGRGHQVHIHNGAGITVQFVKNVIIHGLHIHDIKAAGGGMIRDSPTHFGQRTRSDGDGISIFGSSNVWVDHVSMANCMDGMIDAIEMSTAITVSNCHFTNHNEALLFGANDHSTNDTVMQITLAFNHFGRGLVQRLPRCRFGFCHVVNNHYSRWLMYAVGGSAHPTILSQGNRFNAPNLRFCKELANLPFSFPFGYCCNYACVPRNNETMRGLIQEHEACTDGGRELGFGLSRRSENRCRSISKCATSIVAAASLPEEEEERKWVSMFGQCSPTSNQRLWIIETVDPTCDNSQMHISFPFPIA